MGAPEAAVFPERRGHDAGRVAVIGAAGGIGRACVSAFARTGWTVLAADLDADAASAALAGQRGGSTAHRPAALDVTDHAAVEALAEEAGAIDAVVYSAGIVATMPIAETDFSTFRKIMAVNLDGAALVASAFARRMIAREGGGSLVFVSSAAGLRGEANASAYCASKFGLIGLVQSIAAELTAHDIRANAVAPGNVDTPMLRAVARDIAAVSGDDVDTVWTGFAKTGAAQRLITPDEVAATCLALCGPGFSAVTGATVPVDGGYLLGA